MSRSNGPALPAGGPPLHWPDPAETHADQPRAAGTQMRRPAGQPPMHPQQAHPQHHQPHGANGYPNGYQPQQPVQQQQPQPPAYHYPQGGAAQPPVPRPAQPQVQQHRGAHGLVPPVMGVGNQDFGAPPRAAPYAPQFEAAYQQGGQAAQHGANYGAGHQQAPPGSNAYAQQAAARPQRMAPPQHPHQGAMQPPPATRGWTEPQPRPGQPPVNPAAYDLGSYFPSGSGFGQANGFVPHPAQNGANPLHAQRGDHRAYPDTSRGDPGLASLDWQARSPHPQDPNDPYGDQTAYADPALEGVHDQDPNAYAEEMFEEPEAKRGVSKLLVVGILVGTMAVGAGIVKGYSWWQGRQQAQADQRGGRPPTVAAIKAPAKIRPAEPGGNTVPHQGVTILNGSDSRPPEGSTPAKGADSDGAPRRVQTLVIGKDGSMQAQEVAAAAPPPAAVAGVPGMIVEMPRGVPTAEQGAPPQQAPAKAAAAIQPKIVSAPPPVASPQAQAVAQAQPQARVITVPPRQPVPKEKAAAGGTQVAAAPVPSAAPTGAGYVAAVVSRKSQMDALSALAEIQQKYAAILQGKTATVQEANLGEKGVWYRVIVGPPGSREAAASVCGQLKSHGFQGCWTFAY